MKKNFLSNEIKSNQRTKIQKQINGKLNNQENKIKIK